VNAINPDNLLARLTIKNKSVISRLISIVESERENYRDIMNMVFPKTGNAMRIGITGPPGAGKSTITNELTKLFREEKKTVAIIAVDPTSPFTGGALLGDRVRMNDIGEDEGVFIRSMATRGSLGGLSRKSVDTADIVDAAGYDVIIFETVGVGQSELDIVKAADTTIVILVPESGDSVQAMKAGLMEIADFFVMNKSDRPGSDNAVSSISSILQLKSVEDEWKPTIIKSVATDNKGIDSIKQEVARHRQYLIDSSRLTRRRNKNLERRIKEIIADRLYEEIWDSTRSEELSGKVDSMRSQNSAPYLLAEEILKNFI
jgi:LAO/AO transport system kinase